MSTPDLPDAQATATTLGDRLRARRLALGLTLKEVARSAGLSVGFISQVERDLTAPSLVSLAAMAAALKVSPASLLPAPAAPAAETRSSQRPAHATFPGHPVRYERLSTVFPGSTINSVIIHEMPGFRGHASSHEGEEMFFVLSGAITVEVDGRATVLQPGDSLHFSSRRRHLSWNHTDAPAAILHVCTLDVFGDRIPEARPGLHENHRPAAAEGERP